MPDQDEHLDGCEIGELPIAVTDEELPYVILGDSPERIEEYRRLFAVPDTDP